MTIGQRIAALRKERRLSQEELGAQVGVSRQAIYKWESDASLPDIDKLIALSKLFGVSVGWLLGVEEPAAQTQEAPEQTDELTEQQLKMVEEIVGRYIAAQPKPQPMKKKKWPYVVATVAIIAGLLTLSNLNGKLNRLDNQYNNLQNSVNNIQYNVSSQIGGISNRVEEILKSQNNLTASYDTSLLRVDPKANTATFSLRTVPKTYVEGMTATFCATQTGTGEVTEVVGTLGENQEFSAELTCTLSDNIILSVTFSSGEKKETQQLNQYDCLYAQTIPSIFVDDYDLMYHECRDHTLELKNSYFTTQPESAVVPVESAVITPAKIRSIRVGLFKNKELVSWAEPCEQPANYLGNYPDGTQFYRLPYLTLTVTAGDTLAVAAVVTDEYGRETLSVGEYYVLDEEDGDLTWPDGGSWDYGSDTEGWSY